ncbi:MAG: TetR/AcrR family transcriptional regulator [Pseudomonadota bacterium]
MATKGKRSLEKPQRIEQIERAAQSVFFKKGFFNSTVEEIAENAQISKGTIYLYFKGKDELYVSLMIPMIEELGRLLDRFAHDLTSEKYRTKRDVFMGFYEVYMKLHNYDPDGIKIFQIFQLENLYPVMSKEVRERLKALGKRNFEVARSIIAESIKLGLLPEVEPVKLADVLWSLFLGVMQVEKSKLALSKKDHMPGTLEFAFSLISDGL